MNIHITELFKYNMSNGIQCSPLAYAVFTNHELAGPWDRYEVLHLHDTLSVEIEVTKDYATKYILLLNSEHQVYMIVPLDYESVTKGLVRLNIKIDVIKENPVKVMFKPISSVQVFPTVGPAIDVAVVPIQPLVGSPEFFHVYIKVKGTWGPKLTFKELDFDAQTLVWQHYPRIGRPYIVHDAVYYGKTLGMLDPTVDYAIASVIDRNGNYFLYHKAYGWSIAYLTWWQILEDMYPDKEPQPQVPDYLKYAKSIHDITLKELMNATGKNADEILKELGLNSDLKKPAGTYVRVSVGNGKVTHHKAQTLTGYGITDRRLMKFDPQDNKANPYPSEAHQYRQYHGGVAWLYNPYTGLPRNSKDIGSDVYGHLIC